MQKSAFLIGAVLAAAVLGAMPAKASLIGDTITCSASSGGTDLFDGAVNMGPNTSANGPNVVLDGTNGCTFTQFNTSNAPPTAAIVFSIDVTEAGNVNFLEIGFLNTDMSVSPVPVGTITVSLEGLEWSDGRTIDSVDVLATNFPDGTPVPVISTTSTIAFTLNLGEADRFGESFEALLRINTAFIGAPPPGEIPLPATLPLLGFAIGGLALWRRRRKA